MTTAKKARRKFFVPSITNTTRYDTITMEQWHRYRDAEYERIMKEKEKEEEE